MPLLVIPLVTDVVVRFDPGIDGSRVTFTFQELISTYLNWGDKRLFVMSSLLITLVIKSHERSSTRTPNPQVLNPLPFTSKT